MGKKYKEGFTLIRTLLRRNLAAKAVRTRFHRNLVNVHGFTLIELLVDTNNIVTITSDNPENGVTVSLSR